MEELLFMSMHIVGLFKATARGTSTAMLAPRVYFNQRTIFGQFALNIPRSWQTHRAAVLLHHRNRAKTPHEIGCPPSPRPRRQTPSLHGEPPPVWCAQNASVCKVRGQERENAHAASADDLGPRLGRRLEQSVYPVRRLHVRRVEHAEDFWSSGEYGRPVGGQNERE